VTVAPVASRGTDNPSRTENRRIGREGRFPSRSFASTNLVRGEHKYAYPRTNVNFLPSESDGRENNGTENRGPEMKRRLRNETTTGRELTKVTLPAF
jgi:hypothetical protein